MIYPVYIFFLFYADRDTPNEQDNTEENDNNDDELKVNTIPLNLGLNSTETKLTNTSSDNLNSERILSGNDDSKRSEFEEEMESESEKESEIESDG